MDNHKMNKPEEMFYNFGMKVFKTWGLDTLSAKLVCILYIHPEKISISELAEYTGYSLASVSNKLKAIEAFGIVEKIKEPGSKKVYYYMESDIFKQFEKKMNNAYKIEIQPAKDTLPGILDSYKGLKLTKEEKERKEVIENYYNQILEMDRIFIEMKDLFSKRRKENKK